MAKQKSYANYWQNANNNIQSVDFYRNWILSIAINCFEWINMPAGCDPLYFEKILTLQGKGTIAKHPSLGWVSTQCTTGQLNIYDQPIAWTSTGNNGWHFDCSQLNGVVVYDNSLHASYQWQIEQWARRLADIDNTIDCNLKQQKMPWIFSCPQEKVYDMTNIVKQAMGGEPAILGIKGIENIKAELLATPVDFIGQDLLALKASVFAEIYNYFGVDALPKKNERMIEDEVESTNEPASIRALDRLNQRRAACKQLNELFGLDLNVVWRKDNISENYNFISNIQAQEENEGGAE